MYIEPNPPIIWLGSVCQRPNSCPPPYRLSLDIAETEIPFPMQRRESVLTITYGKFAVDRLMHAVWMNVRSIDWV